MPIKDKLEKDLELYKKVVLVESSFPRAEEVLAILEEFECVHCYVRPDIEKTCISEPIDAEQEKELLDLYYLYEFSDRFSVCGTSDQFGTVWNYVDAGLMTFDDAVKSIVN